MSGVVQHKSAFAHGQTVSVTLDSDVTEGNLIAVVVGTNQLSYSPTVSDGVNSYSLAVQGSDTVSNDALVEILSAIARESGPLTVTITVPSNEDLHLHVYEVNGYDTLDQVGSFGHSGIEDGESFSVSTGGATALADEFVLAAFFNVNNNTANWTGGEAGSATETTDTLAGNSQVFSEGFDVSGAGTQTATATTNAFCIVAAAAIATFYKYSLNPSQSGDQGSWPRFGNRIPAMRRVVQPGNANLKRLLRQGRPKKLF